MMDQDGESRTLPPLTHAADTLPLAATPAAPLLSPPQYLNNNPQEEEVHHPSHLEPSKLPTPPQAPTQPATRTIDDRRHSAVHHVVLTMSSMAANPKHYINIPNWIRLPILCDLVHGNVRSMLVMCLTFVLIIFGSCTFVILALTSTPSSDMSLEFFGTLPLSGQFGVPLPSVRMRLVDGNQVPLTKRNVTLTLTAAQPFTLNTRILYQDIPNFHVNCLADSYWRQRGYICNNSVIPGAMNMLSVITDDRGVATVDGLTLYYGNPGIYQFTATFMEDGYNAPATASTLIQFSIILYKLTVTKPADTSIPLGRPINVVLTTTFSVTNSTTMPPLIASLIPMRLPIVTSPIAGYVSESAISADDEPVIEFETQFATVEHCKFEPRSDAPAMTCILNFTSFVSGAHGAKGGLAVTFMGRTVAATVHVYDDTAYPKRLVTSVPFESAVASLQFFLEKDNTLVPYNLTTMLEATRFDLSFRALDAQGSPVPGVRIALRALNNDSIVTAYPYASKYLVVNVSSQTNADGIASISTAFSSIGTVGTYYIRARVASLTAETPNILVTSRVASLSALLGKDTAVATLPEPNRFVGVVVAGVNNDLITKENTALAVSAVSPTSDFAATTSSNGSEDDDDVAHADSAKVIEAIPGKSASLRFRQPSHGTFFGGVIVPGSGSSNLMSDLSGTIVVSSISVTALPVNTTKRENLMTADILVDDIVVGTFGVTVVNPGAMNTNKQKIQCGIVTAEIADRTAAPFPQSAVPLNLALFASSGQQLDANGNLTVSAMTSSGDPVTVTFVPAAKTQAPMTARVELSMALPQSTRSDFEHVTVFLWDGRCVSTPGIMPAGIQAAITVPIRPVIADLVTISFTPVGYAMFQIRHRLSRGAYGPTRIRYYASVMPTSVELFANPVQVFVPVCVMLGTANGTVASDDQIVQCTLDLSEFASAVGEYTLVPRYEQLDFVDASFVVEVTLPKVDRLAIDQYFVTPPSLLYGVRILAMDPFGAPVPDVVVVLSLRLLDSTTNKTLLNCDVWATTDVMKNCSLALVEMNGDFSTRVTNQSYISGTPLPPARSTGADGWANFQLIEVSGLPTFSDAWLWYFVASCNGVETAALLDNEACGCYNTNPDVDLVEQALVFNNFPISAFPQSDIMFEVNTQQLLWNFGMLAYPSCYDALTGANVVCLWLDVPEYTFPSHFFVAGSETFTIANLQFPIETAAGRPYTIKVQLPGLPRLISLGTVTITQNGCTGSIETPPPANVTALSAFPITVLFRCGAVPVRNKQAFATLIASDPTCLGTACGVINAPLNSAYTDAEGRASFSVVVSDAQSSTYSLRFAINDPQSSIAGAMVDPSLALGVDLDDTTSRPTSVIMRFFNSITNEKNPMQQAVSVTSLSFYVMNPIVGVELLEQPESIEGVHYKDRPLHFTKFPKVRVVVGPGGSLHQIVSFVILNADTNLIASASIDLANGRRHAVTDLNGTVEFSGLVFNRGPPGNFRLVFFCRGIASEPSEVFSVEGPEHISIAEIKEESEIFSLVFLALSVPLLWANVPGTPWYVVAFAAAICVSYLSAAQFIFGLTDKFEPKTLLTVHVAFSFAIVSVLAVSFIAMLVIMAMQHFSKNNSTAYRFMDDEERMIRYFRYTFWMYHWRAKVKLTHQQLLERDMAAQALTWRKRLLLPLALRIEHALHGRLVGENIAERLLGPWKAHEAWEPYWPPMGRVPWELEARLPPRVVMVCSVGSALCFVLSYVGYFLLASLDNWMAVVESDLATLRDATNDGARSNSLIIDALTGAIEMLTVLLPNDNLSLLRQLDPYIRQIDFVGIIDSVATIVTSIRPNIFAFGVAAVACGILSVGVTLRMTVEKARSYALKMRRGIMPIRTGVELEEADEYVGVHCVHIAFTFVVAVLGFMVAACLALFAKSIAMWLWAFILTLGILFIVENLISTFMSYFLHSGIYMSQPKIYGMWTVPAAVLSVFSGFMVLTLRVAKYGAVFCTCFSRFEIRMIPTTMFTADTAHERFVAMIAVDNLYNNPIVLTYAGYFAAIAELKYYAIRAKDKDPGLEPLAPSIFGTMCAFPHIRNMVRMHVSVMMGLIDPRYTPFRGSWLSKSCATVRSALFPRPCEVIARRANEMSAAGKAIPQNIDEIMSFDVAAVKRRRMARRWFLLVLLHHNPTLRQFRKHNLLIVMPAVLLHFDAHHSDHSHHHHTDLNKQHVSQTDVIALSRKFLQDDGEQYELHDVQRPLLA